KIYVIICIFFFEDLLLSS
ncbi:hypothetical protein, partial [Plasmodium yoelii yoelii]